MMSNWKRRVIGVLTLGGSFTGVAVIATQLVSLPWNSPSFLILLVFAALYGFGIVIAAFFLERDARSLIFIFIFWLIQIPVVSSSWLSYEFFSGLRFNLVVSADGVFNLSPSFGSQFSFFIGQEVGTALGVNLVAIAVAFETWRTHRNVCFDGADVQAQESR